MESKKVIGVAQVLQHLKDGMTRDDIAKHYNITKSECKLVFQDARLKGKKTIKKPTFTLVDDETADVAVVDAVEVTTDKAGVTVVDDASDDNKVDDTLDNVADDTGVDDNASDDTKVPDAANADGPIETDSPKATWGD